MTFNEAKSIPIPEYLSKLGIEPARKWGYQYWYLSPFRKEHDPSLKVDTKRNIWYDHGSGVGGTIIDLGTRLHSCSVHEFMLKLTAENFVYNPTMFNASLPVAPPEDRLHILAVRELTSPYLLSYLAKRGIYEHVAAKYCKEVDFRIRDNEFFAIGFINRSGGYELRNPWLKRASAPKDISLLEHHKSNDISFIENSLTKVCVLEGFIDFLSLQQMEQPEFTSLKADSSFLILNSLSFLRKSIELINSFTEKNIFLDCDDAGLKAKTLLKSSEVEFYDASIHYTPSKDLNDYHVKHFRTYGRTKGKSI